MNCIFSALDVIFEGSNALHTEPSGGMHKGFSYFQSDGHIELPDDIKICGFSKNLYIKKIKIVSPKLTSSFCSSSILIYK